MPDLPLVERIARNLLDTVKGIKTVAGYHNTVTALRREQFGRYSQDRLVVLTQGDAERQLTAPHNGFAVWHQEFVFGCIVVEPEDGYPLDQRINSIRADVEKAVMIDPHRGKLAIDTWPNGAAPFLDETGAAIAGIDVSVTVKYRTTLTDPNTQA